MLMLGLLGCSYGISVRRSNGPDLLRAWRSSVVEADALSPRSMQTLHRYDLETAYKHRPLEAYQFLQRDVAKQPDPERLFALAEMSYLLGKKTEKHDQQHACRYYYLCAGYAYHYLFPQAGNVKPAGVEFETPWTPGQREFEHFAFDPRFRFACDLYNTGLAKCITAAQRVGRLDPRQELHLPTSDGQGFTLSVDHHGFPWRPDEFGPLMLCADYEVVGLANHYRGFGLGVALIGVRAPELQARDQSLAWVDRHVRGRSADREVPAPLSPIDSKPLTPTEGPNPTMTRTAGRFPHEVSFPVTAFFRFEGSVADLGTQRSGRLELYNPLAIQNVQIQNHKVPLETDLTTPLAYFLSRTDLEGIEYAGFLSADKIQDRAGIYMFEPYQPGKIPVVMVHGLLSSPLCWTTMFNDLRADPELRKRYQFWFYLYPTGNPFLATAADLRHELGRLRGELDPAGKDGALDHMVLVGHSMGGLVSRLLATDSGDDFWKLVADRPLDDLKVSPDTRAELQRVFYFRQQSCVEREIFLATPHHGSKLSPSPAGRLAARFVKLPKRLMLAAGDLSHADPTGLIRSGDSQLANSVDMLEPHAPALELLAARPRPPTVHFHSIIGSAYGEGEKSTDGVVPYTSSHLDNVDSELILAASHMTIHDHPRAVMEVRRILLEHLRAMQQDGVVPIPTTPGPEPNGTWKPCAAPGSK
jgi:pimeloyl-ACP methyl ester carboxylesterase